MFIMFTENIADGRPILYVIKAFFLHNLIFHKYLKTETITYLTGKGVIAYEVGNMTVRVDVLNTSLGYSTL